MPWDIRNEARKLVNAIAGIPLLEHQIPSSRFLDGPLDVPDEDGEDLGDLKN